MDGSFTNADFQEVKSRCEKEINSLEKKLPDIIQATKMVDKTLNGCLSNIKRLNISYKGNDIAAKRRFISSTHPKNVLFDGAQHRTNRLNEIAGCIIVINNKLGTKKIGQMQN